MATIAHPNRERIPGVPLGASKREALALVGSLALLLVLALCFWWSATH
jgi:hypothetical protein